MASAFMRQTPPLLSLHRVAFAAFAASNFFASVGVHAQTTNVTCLSEYSWMSNSLGQSPCLVAAFLGAMCYGIPFQVSILSPNEHYHPPPGIDDCKCSSVFFSLASACAVCQNRSTLPWSVWSQECTNDFVGTWPKAIPYGTAVPAWAFLKVTKTNTFDAELAHSVDTLPESTATRRTQRMEEPTGMSGSTAVCNPSPQPGNDAGSISSWAVAAIAGGLVGGLVALLVTRSAIADLRREMTTAVQVQNSSPLPSPEPTSKPISIFRHVCAVALAISFAGTGPVQFLIACGGAWYYYTWKKPVFKLANPFTAKDKPRKIGAADADPSGLPTPHDPAPTASPLLTLRTRNQPSPD